MAKKIIINVLIVLLIIICMHYLRIYNIIKNAYATSEIFNNANNILLTRQVYNKDESGEDILNATIEYRIANNWALVIIKDANDKIANVFKVNLETYTVEEFAYIEGAFIKQSESNVPTPQEYLDNTLCYLTEGRTPEQFFVDSLFRIISIDKDDYVLKVRSQDGSQDIVYLSRQDFTVTKIKEANKTTTTYKYELGVVTDDMLDIHNL